MKTRNSISTVKLSSGYTLLELLVAMFIGLFLLGGAFQITQVNKQANRLQKTIQQTQKNGRFAIDTLSYAIKSGGYSGFYGSLTDEVENLLNNPTNKKWNVSIPLSGFDNVSSGKKIAGITGFTPKTDVLLVKGMTGNSVSIISNPDPSTVVAATTNAFAKGDIVIVSDVDLASVFQINSLSSNKTKSTLTLKKGGGKPGNSALLSNSFNSDAEIGKYDVQLFYIKNGRNGSPALFKASLFLSAGKLKLMENELASDINDMQISYGIDNNNDGALDSYHDASTVPSWDQLVSINVALLASSNEKYALSEKSSFSFDKELVTFVRDKVASTDADRHLKRVFRTYMPLRN